VAEGKFRRKHTKMNACQHHTLVSSPVVAGLRCQSVPAVVGREGRESGLCHAAQGCCSKLLLQGYEDLMKDLPFPRRTGPSDRCLAKALRII